MQHITANSFLSQYWLYWKENNATSDENRSDVTVELIRQSVIKSVCVTIGFRQNYVSKSESDNLFREKEMNPAANDIQMLKKC